MDVSGGAEPERAVVLMPDRDASLSIKRRLLQGVATATLAACALLPVNGFASAAPSAAGGRAVVATPAQTPYGGIATQTLDDIVSGDFTAATAHFDTTLRNQLPPDALARAWDAYQDAFGRYKSHGDPKEVAFGGLTVVNVPLSMEHRPGEFRVTFHKDGSIAGLWFLPTGVPIA